MAEMIGWEKDQVFEFVSLSAGGQDFCVEITTVREIRRWSQVTPLPYSEASVLGVMNLRGTVIPIIDLAARLGLPATEVGARNVVVVTTMGSRTIGLLVDAVSEILSVKGEEIRPNPTQRRDGTPERIVGLVSSSDTLLRVLDLDSVIAEKDEAAA